MADSLSVVLPVHNAQSVLNRRVESLLDTLSELSDKVELLIIDDGSTDQTEEVATELARKFPQIRFERHSARQGATAASAAGVERTTGSVVIVHDIEAGCASERLRELWSSRSSGSPEKKRGPHLPTIVARRGDATTGNPTRRRVRTDAFSDKQAPESHDNIRATRPDLETCALAIPPSFFHPVDAAIMQ